KDNSQSLQRTGGALLRRLSRQPEAFADFLCRLPLEVAQQDGVPIVLIQLRQGGIQVRRDLVPDGLRAIRVEISEGGSFPLPLPAPFLAADRLQREIPSGLMEPSRKHRAMFELFGISGQGDKYSLAHFVRKLRIA